MRADTLTNRDRDYTRLEYLANRYAAYGTGPVAKRTDTRALVADVKRRANDTTLCREGRAFLAQVRQYERAATFCPA